MTQPKLTQYQKSKRVAVQRSQLKGADYNPRLISKNARARLKSSLRSHGYLGGIVWNKRTGNVVGGHQRIGQIDVLEDGEDYLIEVDEIDVSLDEEKEINIALNNTTMQGEFDNDKLAIVLTELAQSKRNVERTGFTTHDILERLGDVALTGAPARQAEEESAAIDSISRIYEASHSMPADLPSDTTGKEPTMVIPTPKEPDPRSTPEALAARRKEYAAEIEDDEDADYMVHFIFDNNETRSRFQRHFGLKANQRTFSRFDIEAAFGVDLGVED